MEYKTGDLFLGNQWSISSILNHVEDVDTKWSDVGIFLVDTYEDNTSSKVFLMGRQGPRIIELSELLKIPSIQQAAHRELNIDNRKAIVNLMKEYMAKVMSSNPVNVSSPMKQLMMKDSQYRASMSDIYSKTNLGTFIDNKGKDLVVSGFSKGNANNRLKSGFTNADLIGSVLAYAKIISYNPELMVSDFQEGGLVDQFYGDETPLFPIRNNISNDGVRNYLIELAKEEAIALVMQYYDSTPLIASSDFNNSSVVVNSDNRMETAGAQKSEWQEQLSNSYALAGNRKKCITNEKALENESNTIDLKLRQRNKEAAKYERPKPGFKK